MVSVDGLVAGKEAVNGDNFGDAIDILLGVLPTMDANGRKAVLLALSGAAKVGMDECMRWQDQAEKDGNTKWAGTAFYLGAGFMEIGRQCCFEVLGKGSMDPQQLAGVKALYETSAREYTAAQFQVIK